MTISQLIAELQQVQEQYGDLEVVTYSQSGDDTIPVAGPVIRLHADEQ